MGTSRAIVRLDENGRLMRGFPSVPMAADIIGRKESDVKEWVRNPQLIRMGSRWMYEKDYLRACDDEGMVKELAFCLHRDTPPTQPGRKSTRKDDDTRQRRRMHTGTIYTELHNRGRRKGNVDSGNSVSTKLVKGVGMVMSYKYRWVAEITFQRKRYCCRSAHFHVVKDWLDEMINRFS